MEAYQVRKPEDSLRAYDIPAALVIASGNGNGDFKHTVIAYSGAKPVAAVLQNHEGPVTLDKTSEQIFLLHNRIVRLHGEHIRVVEFQPGEIKPSRGIGLEKLL